MNEKGKREDAFMNNKTNFLLLGLFSLLLGALSGVVLWAVLQVMNGGIVLLWEVVPSYLFTGSVYGRWRADWHDSEALWSDPRNHASGHGNGQS